MNDRARILVVEDEGIIAEEIRHFIASLGHEVVAVCGRAEKAVEAARAERPDLVLMDIILKGSMDGIAAAGLISSETGIPVVFLTAHGDSETVNRAKLAGPSGYLFKPVNRRELEVAIDIALYRHRMEHDLRQGELRYRTIFESANDSIFIFDSSTGHILDMNTRACEALGYRKEDLVGSPLSGLSGDFSGCMELSRVFHEAGCLRYEQSFKRSDGELVDLELSCRPIEYDGIGAVQAMARDITERKRMDRELRALRQAVESMRIGMYFTGSDGKVSYINPAGSRMYGYRRGEVLGRRPADLGLAGADTEASSGMSIEVDTARKDGTPFTVSVLSDAVMDASGSESGAVVSFENTTEKRRLRDSLKQKSMIIDQTHDAVVTTNMKGIITGFNAGAERLYGYSPSEVIGRHVDLLYRADDRTGMRSMVAETLLKRGHHELEVVNIDRFARELDVHLSLMVIRNELGRGEAIVGYSIDISELKKAERAMRESESRYRTLFESSASGIAYMRVVRGEGSKVGDFVFVDVNTSFLDALGMERDKVVGRRSGDVFTGPGERDEAVRMVSAAMADGRPVKFEQHLAARSRWFAVTVHALGEEFVIATYEDVTSHRDMEDELAERVQLRGAELMSLNEQLSDARVNREKVEAALSDSELRFSTIFDQSPIGMLLLNTGGSVLMANASACGFFGLSPDKITGMAFAGLGHGDDAGDIGSTLESLLGRDTEVSTCEARFRRAEGGQAWGRLTACTMRDAGGVQYIVAMVEDVSARKHDEEAIQELLREQWEALKEVRQLGGLLPMCPACRKVRDDKGYWSRIEEYVTEHSGARFQRNLCPECSARSMHAAHHAGHSAGPDDFVPFTGREREILAWIKEGKSTWDISGILGISESTVKFHVGNAMRKLNAVSRAQAVAIAVERGLLSTGPDGTG